MVFVDEATFQFSHPCHPSVNNPVSPASGEKNAASRLGLGHERLSAWSRGGSVRRRAPRARCLLNVFTSELGHDLASSEHVSTEGAQARFWCTGAP